MSQLEKIIKIEISAFKMYKKLLDLELANKRVSKEYFETLGLFSEIEKIEDRLIKNCEELEYPTSDTVDYLINRSAYLTEDYNFFGDVTENTIEDNYIVARILEKASDNYYSNITISDEDYIYEAIENIEYIIEKELDYKRIISIKKMLNEVKDEKTRSFLTKYMYSLKYVTNYENINKYKNDNNRKQLELQGYQTEVVNIMYENRIRTGIMEIFSGILEITDKDIEEDKTYLYEVEILCNEIRTIYNLCCGVEEKDRFVKYINNTISEIWYRDSKIIIEATYALKRLTEVLNIEHLETKEEYEKEKKNYLQIGNRKIKVFVNNTDNDYL